MFTGIIETTGEIIEIRNYQQNQSFLISSPIAKEVQKGDSISHNGVCLTVEEVLSNSVYQVTAIKETLSKTNLGFLKPGDKINLERSVLANGKIDGHFVQGHVDCIGIVTHKQDREGSFEFEIAYPNQFQPLVIPRGSIAINGISLTISSLKDDRKKLNSLPDSHLLSIQDDSLYSFLYIHIIPYTYQITNIQYWKEGSIINIEFDVLGKYIQRIQNLYNQTH